MILYFAFSVIFLAIVFYPGSFRPPPGIPSIGKPGIIGYVQSTIRYMLHSTEVLAEGTTMFKGRPFALPTLGGWIIVLNKDHFETLRSSNDTIFNQPIAVNNTLQLDHTMNPDQQRNPFQAVVTRNDITRNIASFIPDVLDETIQAMKDTFEPSGESGAVTLPIFHTITHMVGRISNRTMLGLELCRNEHFLHAVVAFAETLVLYAQLLNWSPSVLRSLVYFVLSSLFGGPKQPKKFIVPYVEERLRQRRISTENGPHNIAEFLINAAPPDEGADGIAMRILNLNFGSIHTTSIFLTQSLLEMSMMSEEALDSIRAEVIHALEEEGGWNKASLSRFRKIDSILREVGRVYGLALMGMGRITVKDGQLPDGTVIPAGWNVVMNLRSIHFDPETYPDPEVFDPFRFSKLRDAEDSGVKHGFTTVDSHYLPFSAGRHACPGRFFAAMVLKITIANLLLNYDFHLPDSQPERPSSVIFHGNVIPNQKACLVLSTRKRKV